jgi:hypothetical protein
MAARLTDVVNFSDEVPTVSSVALRPLERACFAPSQLVTVDLPAPLLAVEACLDTTTLLVLGGDDDTWGEHRPPTAGSGVSEAPVAVTSMLLVMFIFHIFCCGLAATADASLASVVFLSVRVA